MMILYTIFVIGYIVWYTIKRDWSKYFQHVATGSLNNFQSGAYHSNAVLIETYDRRVLIGILISTIYRQTGTYSSSHLKFRIIHADHMESDKIYARSISGLLNNTTYV